MFALRLTCLPCKANRPPWSWALPRTELQSINLKDLVVHIVVNASRPQLSRIKGKELAEGPAGTGCRDLHRGCRQVVHAPCCVSEVACPDRRQYMRVVLLPHHHTSALVPNAAFWISFLPSPSRREAAGRQGERLVTIFAGQEHKRYSWLWPTVSNNTLI